MSTMFVYAISFVAIQLFARTVAFRDLLLYPESWQKAADRTASFTCTVVDPWLSVFKFKKIVPSEHSNYTFTVSNEAIVNLPFSNTGRYTVVKGAAYRQEGQEVVNYTLTITDIEPADSGYVGCEVSRGDRIADRYSPFTVIAPLKNLEMAKYDIHGVRSRVQDRSEVTFRANQQEGLSCDVYFATTAPKIVVTIGGRDVTRKHFGLPVIQNFTSESTLRTGLPKYSKLARLDSGSFNPEISDTEKELVCRAEVPYQPALVRKVTLNVEGPVEVIKGQCHNHVTAALGKDVELSCRVAAHPPVTRSEWRWFNKRSGKLITLVNHANINNTHFGRIRTEGIFYNITLRINRVNQSDFNEYNLSVDNNYNHRGQPHGSVQTIQLLRVSESPSEKEWNIESMNTSNITHDQKVVTTEATTSASSLMRLSQAAFITTIFMLMY